MINKMGVVGDDSVRLKRAPMNLSLVENEKEDVSITRDKSIINDVEDDDGEYEAPPIFISGSSDDGIVEGSPIHLKKDFEVPKRDPEYVEADLAYKIISSDEEMDKFYKIIENWTNDDVQECIDGIIAVPIRFQKYGFQFSEDQIKRIKKITGFDVVNRTDLTEEEKEKVDKFTKYWEVFISDDLYDKYLKSKDLDTLINGISKKELNKNMSKVLYSFKIHSSSLSDEIENRFWRFKVVQDCYYKYYLDEDIKINPELEKRVMENIPKSLSDILMAYNIYIELNKAVSLDSRFYINGQFDVDEYNTDLLSKNIDEASSNNYICKIWSDAYYYLIKKYTNIDCFISLKTKDGEGHRYVMLLMDNGETIAVDGTNVVHDNMLDTNFTDILRCKLGLPTVNFTSYKDYHLKKDNFDEKAEPKDIMQKILNIAGTKEEIQKLNELIKNSNLDTISKLKLFIDFIEKRKDLDSISMRALFSNLVYLFFKGQERVKALDYYKEIDNGQYEYINCVKYTDPKTNEDVYLMLDKELGFIETNLLEINDMLKNGDIKNIPRRRF